MQMYVCWGTISPSEHYVLHSLSYTITHRNNGRYQIAPGVKLNLEIYLLTNLTYLLADFSYLG